MLTKEEMASLEAMSQEDLTKLLGLIREAKALYGHRDGMSMPPSAVEKMTEVVGDQLMKDIVKDLRGGRAQPGGFVPEARGRVVEALRPEPEGGPKEPGYLKPEGKGWANPLPLEPRGDLKWIDRAMDVQDALDRRELQHKLRRI